MDFEATKRELRNRTREEIESLPYDYIVFSNAGLLRNCVSLNEFASARNIMLYCSVEREPCTLGIAEAALSAGKTVAFPFCFRGGIMQARAVSAVSELRPAMLGIPAPPEDAPVIAPEDLDIVIVPAIAFDEGGYRLGYGGGYYDRYLCSIPAYTIGLARERLIKGSLPRESHDISVRCVVTESEVRYFDTFNDYSMD